MKFRRKVLSLTAACTLCLPVVIAAQENSPAKGPEIKVTMDGCPGEDFEALLSKINLEAAAFSPGVREWMAEIGPEVSITCKGKVLSIRVADPDSERFLEHHIDVDDAVSRDMARYVAVAVVELIEAGEEELGSSLDETNPQVNVNTAPPSEAHAQSKVESIGRLTMGPVFWLGGSPRWTSFGGSAGLEVSIRGWLVPALDLEGIWGDGDVTLGTISAFQLSGAGLLLFRLPIKLLSLMIGPGFRAGAVFWKGTPEVDVNATGERNALPWNGPCAVLRVSFAINDVMELGIGIQGGWYTYESHAQVDGTPEISLEGVWFRAGLLGKVKIF
ncbi:MAG: hypothetical protein GY854_20090 [Deltaproteobacteria bacterium]|nr:hypothetical protein [Deltaproteobacteria bacterium]